MKNFIILILVLLSSICAFANNEDFESKIESLIDKTDPNINIGIKITNLSKNQVVFEKNPDRYFTPASAMKFITIISLYEYFGPDYQFASTVSKKGKDYYINIHNPNFKLNDLNYLSKAIIDDSEKEIEGNIYIVDDKFSLPPVILTKSYKDTINCYGAPITKSHLDKNCSKLTVSASRAGQPIKIKIDKDFPYTIQNNAKTLPKNQPNKLYATIADNKYIINGTLSANTGQMTIGAVTNNNLQQIKNHLENILSKNDIKFLGKILYEKLPKNTKQIANISSSFKEIVGEAMKKSDNFTTDYLFAEFATLKKHTNWINATDSLKKFVYNKFAVDLTKSEINDASGISRINLLTVNQFSSFLNSVSQKTNFEEIKDLMAKPGDESTLLKRFKNVKNLYTKTGKLKGNSSLVGYFYDHNNELHSFVIMINNFCGSRSSYNKLEEDIIKLFI